ncbi:phosphatase PAP2 family protein [Hyphomicrobium sp. xq]|uniref:Phosphatase PAP2 family protein n=1 Tax=Hyphomicrobium album TaxID=2665159 RepID=A0A6I3KN08_9HYPH|nr:phosphatase PAP2 family protein [Hyphomicrobium album]MTD94081.1 phosphatase PAP2 family protein [Hyphomicrobium album]
MLSQRGNHKRTSRPSSSVVVAGHAGDNRMARSEGTSGVAPARQANTAGLSAFDWRRAAEIRVIGALLFLSLLLLGLLMIGSRALTGDAMVYDWAIVLALRNPLNITDPLGPDWFESITVDLGYLGSVTVVGAIALAVMGYFLLVRRRDLAILVFAAVSGTAIVTTLLKLAVARPGINLAMMRFETSTFSFPSGHAALSAAIYLTLAALIARAQSQQLVKYYVLGLACALTLIIGASRVFNTVHFPTDVLAGWSVGAAWTLVCLFAISARSAWR